MAENAGTIYYEVDAKTDKVIDAGRRATETLDNLQNSFDKTDRAADRNAKTMERTARATDKEASALTALLGRIDPVVAATRRLDDMQDQLSAAFAKGQLSVSQYNSYLAKLDAQYARLNGSTEVAQKKASTFGTSLTPLAAAIAGVITVQTLKQWGQMAEQFTLLQSRIGRLSPDLATAASNYKMLLVIASQTGQTMPATVKLWESLTTSLKSLGATNDQVLVLTGTLQKIGKIGGSSAEETANALRQLGQSLAGGTLRAEEYNSIVEQTPELIRQLAAASKMSMGQFRQAMLDGKITSQQLFDLLLQQVPAVDAEFKKIPRSASDAGNAVSVAFGAALAKIDEATGASRRLVKVLDSIARTTNDLAGNLQGQEKFNKLIRERQIAEEQYAVQAENGLTVMAAATQKRIEGLNKEIKAMQDARVEEQKRQGGADGKPKAAPTVTTGGQKALQDLAEQNVLLRAQGVERAKLAAIQRLGAGATESERAAAVALAIENYNLTEAEKARAAEKKKGISEQTKAENAAAALRRQEAKQRQSAADADQKQFAQLGQAIAKVGQTAREAAQDAAQLGLSRFATPDEVQRIRDMAGALYDLQGAKAAVAAVDPIAAQQQNYTEQLKQLQSLNDQKLLSDQRYLELKHQAEVANAEAMKTLNEENFKAQAVGNEILLNSIDALGQSATSAISGILSGTGSLQEALGGIANTVLNSVIGAFVQMGVDWIKQQVMMAAAAQTTTATQVAGTAAVTAAQTAATTTIAATTTTAAASTGTAVAASMAPAAGLSSIASFGGAAVIGGAALLATMLLAKSFGGGRRAGGAVNPGSVYRVNEGGAPEIFSAGGQQYMIPNQRGQVVSNKDATAGSSNAPLAPIVNVNNYSGQGATSNSRFSEADNRYIIDVIVGDAMAGGKSGQVMNRVTGTKRAGT
jgi:tape measure domain